MAAMTSIISKNFDVSIYWIVFFGALFSVPLLMMMCWIIQKWGLLAGLGFAVFTDFLCSLLISSISIKTAIETFIIAVFVIIGNWISNLITARLF